VAAVAVVGGIRLQHGVPDFHQDIAVTRGLRQDLSTRRAYMAGEARLPTVHQQLLTCDEFFAEIRDRLEQAQQHYKMFYDHRYRELSFKEGQWVWLRLLHRPIASLEVKNTGKLGPKFYGPF
jgi:hypothetical protein